MTSAPLFPSPLDGAAGRPLEGVKVLECSSYLSGPLCAQMLSDLGAHVLKVEPPTGDPYRNFGHKQGGTSVPWTNANHGKKSVSLDLKAPQDMQRMKALIAEADLYIENWRPHVSASLGLGYEATRALNPRLVHFSITGFGADGPAASEPAYDALLQGRTGLAFFEAAGGTPKASESYLVDKIVAVFCAQMALAALVKRDRTGQAVHLQTSMLDIMSYFNFTDMFQNMTYLEDTAAPAYTPQPILATLDGHIVVSPVTGKQLGRTLEAVGHPEWKEDLKRITDKKEMTRTFFERVAGPLKTRSSAEWVAVFTEMDVPVAPVNSPREHFSDPQVLHNRIYSEMDTPSGRIRVPRHPAQIDGQLLTPRSPAPAIGQHNPPDA
ncbi:CaiB/BaiF CoA transferase family protein [Hydrogenophaga sp. BPS33]|uniref:CaiB/BaiF CoA transferase family protein n=1 Tax=Hydrogenophaga sp. BPS33 TaxID=2651974 RepID=UPI0013201786|nr:CoA transferase [Hydrogenophaga sp. BPS33]QHE84171.1 CoA transferase [Hydrogenophaga sp. BPS33]